MSESEQIYKRDYVFMRLAGGEPERVPVADIGQMLAQGYMQCKPPAEQPTPKED